MTYESAIQNYIIIIKLLIMCVHTVLMSEVSISMRKWTAPHRKGAKFINFSTIFRHLNPGNKVKNEYNNLHIHHNLWTFYLTFHPRRWWTEDVLCKQCDLTEKLSNIIYHPNDYREHHQFSLSFSIWRKHSFWTLSDMKIQPKFTCILFKNHFTPEWNCWR